MRKEEKEHIKEKLEANIIKIETQIADLKEKTKPIAPDCSLGRLTREEAMNEQMMNKKVLSEATLTFTRLNNSLQRVEHPMFGICIECEEPINIERMIIRPESVRCVGCAF